MGSSGQVMAAVRKAAQAGEVISDETARTIASWYHSPAAIDTPITALSHGLEFDDYALWERVSRMIESGQFVSDTCTCAPRELVALKAWVESRMPRVVVVEYDLDGDTWETWSRECGESGRERPDGVEAEDTDVSLVECAARDLADFLWPEDDGYPDKPTEHPGYDASDGSVQVPLPVVKAAAAMLEGTSTGFWAAAYGADPFSPGLYWDQSDKYSEVGPGKPYASRYERPNGTVQIKLATLHGFTPEQEAEVWKLWRGDRA